MLIAPSGCSYPSPVMSNTRRSRASRRAASAVLRSRTGPSTEGRAFSDTNVPKRCTVSENGGSLMNRLVTLLALAIGLGGPASAGIINPYGDPDLNANVVAGQISGSGVRERGFGFRVQRTSA